MAASLKCKNFSVAPIWLNLKIWWSKHIFCQYYHNLFFSQSWQMLSVELELRSSSACKKYWQRNLQIWPKSLVKYLVKIKQKSAKKLGHFVFLCVFPVWVKMKKSAHMGVFHTRFLGHNFCWFFTFSLKYIYFFSIFLCSKTCLKISKNRKKYSIKSHVKNIF